MIHCGFQHEPSLLSAWSRG